MVVYDVLPFTASFKKALKGFLECSLYSTNTVTCMSFKQSFLLILPPGVSSELSSDSHLAPCTEGVGTFYSISFIKISVSSWASACWTWNLSLFLFLFNLYSYLQLEMRGQVKANSALSHAAKARDGAQVSWPAQSLHPFAAGQG